MAPKVFWPDVAYGEYVSAYVVETKEPMTYRAHESIREFRMYGF